MGAPSLAIGPTGTRPPRSEDERRFGCEKLDSTAPAAHPDMRAPRPATYHE